MRKPGIERDAGALMDRMYRHQVSFYDLTRKPYLLGRDRLISELNPKAGGTVLEIACGTGRNLIQAALSYPKIECFGFDVSAVMIEKAVINVQKAHLSNRIQLAQGNATSFSAMDQFDQSSFDRVFVSYALSMIPDWRKALNQALSLTKADGRLFIVDFGEPSQQPVWLRSILIHWLSLFQVKPEPDLIPYCTHIAKETMRPLTALKLWGGYANLIMFDAQVLYAKS